MKIPAYAYFYPLSTACPERQLRAEENGYVLADETQLCQDAEPLYEGHNQPVTYCLGNVALKNWDDADPEAMERQIDLATSNGLDGFIFDTYLGQKQGKKVYEMGSVLDDAFLGTSASNGMEFALMSVLGSPRVVLPVPKTKGFEEKGRYYDPTKGTVEEIIDHSARNYWDRDNYIRIGDRPYLSVFTSDMRTANGEDSDALSLPDTIEYMKEYSVRAYGIEPYIAGVCLKAKHAKPLFERGADAMTGYAFLPNFGADSEPVQDYASLLRERMADWDAITQQIDKPYVPPVVVGWDASPRGINGSRIEDVSGTYPFTPIVEGSNSERFSDMLRAQRAFVASNVPEEERYTPITAWNEVTEGAALLPKVDENGALDKSYLDAVRKVVNNEA
jgi:hypothetical protein